MSQLVKTQLICMKMSIKKFKAVSQYNYCTDQNFDYLKIDNHKNIQDLFNIFLNNGLLPTVTTPIRIMSNSVTLIDNLYISIKHNNAVKSDHLPIFVFVESNISNVKKGAIVRTKRRFDEYVFSDISHKFDWSYLINASVDEAYMQFSNNLNDIIDRCSARENNKNICFTSS